MFSLDRIMQHKMWKTKLIDSGFQHFVGHITYWRIRKIRISRKMTLKIHRDILPLYIKSRIEKQARNMLLPR